MDGARRPLRAGIGLEDVATFSSISRQHVLDSIAEHDQMGAEGFLAAHGFSPSPDAQILHEGQRYDARAILAVAHRRATGRLATPEEFRSSLDQALTILSRRGFEVAGPTAARRAPVSRAARTPGAPKAPRAPRAAPQRKLKPEDIPPALCPTCFMALPATGRCDSCD